MMNTVNKFKPDNEVSPITLVMRKYYEKYKEIKRVKHIEYYKQNKDAIRQKVRDKYATDEVYRERCKSRSAKTRNLQKLKA